MGFKKALAIGGVVAASAVTFAGCGSGGDKGDEVTVKLGVVGAVYEDLWKPAQDKLEIVQFSDYVTPNNALNNGDIDLNAFQHEIYLNTEVQQYNYAIEPAGYTFIIPLNLYSNKVKSVDEIKDGDTIAIPDDLTNGGRALKVLAAAGLIELKSDASFSPTLDDIAKYNKQITIKELKANTIPSTLDDVTAGIINGNYALDFGLKTDDAIFKDTSVNEVKYWNLVAARTSDLQDESKKEIFTKVIKAFQSEETEKVFNEQFGGYFIKEGWNIDLINK